MKLPIGISFTVHGGVLVHSTFLYWTSLHFESLIAILLSGALMGLSIHGVWKGHADGTESKPPSRTPQLERKEKLLRTLFLVLLPLACYYWFVIRPAAEYTTVQQLEASYALLVFQAIVGIAGELFIDLLKGTLRPEQ